MAYSEHFQREAIQLSQKHMQEGHGGPFGAIIVKNGRVVGRGWNRVTSANDPTAHAEIMAIRDACTNLATFSLAGCEIYASCEPCPMCLAAIYWARLDALYFSATRADAAGAGFDDARLYEEIPKTWESRLLKTEQHLPAEGRKVLELWKRNPDSIPY
jgi:tRNA(Arg) A34 adenosine deaminase TadA